MIRQIVFATTFALAASFGSFFQSPGNYTLLCNTTGRYKCHCPADDTSNYVDCSNRVLDDLPNDVTFPDYVMEVNFGRNSLTGVTNTALIGGIKVSSINFSHNKIHFLASDAFANLENLEAIDLSHNDIWTISMEVFHGLKRMVHLDLSYNRLNNFFSDTFKGCDDLKVLCLKYNPMLFLEADTFSYLPRLEELDLTSTGIGDLPIKIFANNTKMHSLHLTANSFLTVPTQALSSAKNLKSLDISENPIKKLKPNSFLELKTLEVLHMNHMRELSELEDFSLGGMRVLKEIYITDNLRLSKISGSALREKVIPETFMAKSNIPGHLKSSPSDEDFSYGMPFLQKLSLRHNALQSLPADLVDWEQLIETDLRENPWQCDCHLAWVAKHHVDKEAVQEATCASPSRLLGRKLSSLVEADYTCSYLTSEATTAMAVLVVAAFLLALGGTGFLLYKRSLISCKRRSQGEPRYTRVVSSKDKVDLEWDHTGEPPSRDSEA